MIDDSQKKHKENKPLTEPHTYQCSSRYDVFPVAHSLAPVALESHLVVVVAVFWEAACSAAS